MTQEQWALEPHPRVWATVEIQVDTAKARAPWQALNTPEKVRYFEQFIRDNSQDRWELRR